jgi:2-keto-4-pentenoate hydratase/2-oxohepta-3-ene-1,7-dioic acid hydratase in catechol pathway
VVGTVLGPTLRPGFHRDPRRVRLVSFSLDGAAALRAGIALGDVIADTSAVARLAGFSDHLSAALAATRRVVSLGDSQLAALAAAASRRNELAAAGALHRRDDVHLGPPVPDAGQLVCVGRNFGDGLPHPALMPPWLPISITKRPCTLAGPIDSILPAAADRCVPFDAELAVVIRRLARHVAPQDALAHVAGAMAFNDTGGELANGSGTRATCGPELVLLDEIGDLQALAIRARVNGRTICRRTTAEMIAGVADTIAFLSRLVPLAPGDIVATGSALACTRSVHPGDVVEVEVDGVGALRNVVA